MAVSLGVPASQADVKKVNTMKVIVFAYEKENHTAPVKWALEQAGYKVACWGGLSWTEQQQAN